MGRKYTKTATLVLFQPFYCLSTVGKQKEIDNDVSLRILFQGWLILKMKTKNGLYFIFVTSRVKYVHFPLSE